jgi:hypothetical protein
MHALASTHEVIKIPFAPWSTLEYLGLSRTYHRVPLSTAWVPQKYPRVRACGLRWSSVGRLCGRRQELESRDRQRGMGCAIFAHVRDRRRLWRHLRHRRLLPASLLQRRVGEHRRRCGPDSRGYSAVLGVTHGYSGVPSRYSRGTLGVLKGYPRGTQGFPRGTQGVPSGYLGFPRGTQGVPSGYSGVPSRYSRGTLGVLSVYANRCAHSCRSVARVAAGKNWNLVIARAPWAARFGHTTVIDATGAIYVIGGRGDTGTYLSDVWASTDGGAGPDSPGFLVGTQ